MNLTVIIDPVNRQAYFYEVYALAVGEALDPLVLDFAKASEETMESLDLSTLTLRLEDPSGNLLASTGATFSAVPGQPRKFVSSLSLATESLATFPGTADNPPRAWIKMVVQDDGGEDGQVYADTKVPILTGVYDGVTVNVTPYASKAYVDEQIAAVEAGAIAIDSALSPTSTHPVQNKVVTAALNTKASTATTLSGYGITDAKIENGVVKLGASSLAPLTANDTNISGTTVTINGSSVSVRTPDDTYISGDTVHIGGSSVAVGPSGNSVSLDGSSLTVDGTTVSLRTATNTYIDGTTVTVGSSSVAVRTPSDTYISGNTVHIGGSSVTVEAGSSASDVIVKEMVTADFPVEGDATKLYIAVSTGKVYHWDGSSYAELSEVTGVVATDVTMTAGSLETVADRLTTLGNAVSGSSTAIAGLSDNVTNLGSSVSGLATDVGVVSSTMDGLSSTVAGMRSDLTAVQSALESITIDADIMGNVESDGTVTMTLTLNEGV